MLIIQFQSTNENTKLIVMMSYWMNVLEVYNFATCGKRCGFRKVLPKRDFLNHSFIDRNEWPWLRVCTSVGQLLFYGTYRPY